MRRILLIVLFVATLPFAAWAQYPTKSIRLLVANAPGGAADATGRIFGGALAQSLGTQIIIDNRAGAGGNIEDIQPRGNLGAADGWLQPVPPCR